MYVNGFRMEEGNVGNKYKKMTPFFTENIYCDVSIANYTNTVYFENTSKGKSTK